MIFEISKNNWRKLSKVKNFIIRADLFLKGARRVRTYKLLIFHKRPCAITCAAASRTTELTRSGPAAPLLASMISIGFWPTLGLLAGVKVQ